MSVPLPIHSTASPANLHSGGNDVSVSYLRDWGGCPRRWFWRHAYNTPEGWGLEIVRTSLPMVVGSAVHAAAAAWRESGWRTGEYSLDAALAALRTHMAGRVHEFPNEDEHADAQAVGEDIFRRYSARWADEYPDFQVASDADGPLLERLFAVPLDGGVTLNVRPDGVVFAHGFLAVLEMKTVAPSRVGPTLAMMERSPQTLAETYALRTLGHDVAGVYIDIAVRGRTRTVSPFNRKLIRPDESLVEAFPAIVGDVVRELQVASEIARDDTLSLPTKLSAFPMLGMFRGESCARCEFAQLCWEFPGDEESALGEYRTRIPLETK